MTADEILKALEESEGFYLEVGAWVVSPAYDEETEQPVFTALKYKAIGEVAKSENFPMLIAALEFALKDGKP